jgi:hypothetical protein
MSERNQEKGDKTMGNGISTLIEMRDAFYAAARICWDTGRRPQAEWFYDKARDYQRQINQLKSDMMVH